MVRKFKVRVNGKEYLVEVEEMGKTSEGPVPKQVQEVTPKVEKTVESQPIEKQEVKEKTQTPSVSEKTTGSVKTIKSPMSGLIVKVLVTPGQNVNSGDKVIILEAMKMENDILADASGKVKSVLVKEGDNVDTGQVLIELD
ncbi:biotin/lipoyl-binding protein [Thermosipho ferrireducens]|uniref:Biotin/lipoyl-binding protein n=1 Tax=Thermosipho ferrireducens TaxID=2571116 RepID=A0ABX7S914_9BACT|nr:biotin/lipoyl-containing protein [Thermosipho ferrireducens]QTA38162.1 biotin/lipoyl-binding protein [Thermosipho ferrireducens]